MLHRARSGFTRRDLLALGVIIGLIAGLVIPYISASREAGRRTQCANNMRQLGLALLNFSSVKNRLPNAGTYFDDPAVHQGDPSRSAIYRSITNPSAFAETANPWLRSWVIDIQDYLDSKALPWDWDRSYMDRTPSGSTGTSNRVVSSIALGVLRCPSAPGLQLRAIAGNQSYVVNGGFVRWPAVPIGWSGGQADGLSTNGDKLEWTPPGRSWRETQAICKKSGVMFLGTHSGDQLWDISTTATDIVDGSSMTLLVGENTLAGESNGTPYSGGIPTNWACPLPNFCMFIGSDDICHTASSSTACLGGQLQPIKRGAGYGTGPGWALASHPASYERINYGRNLTVKGSFPFVSSGHPGGANFAFCDGSTRFISQTIDGRVYAELITPAGSKLPQAIWQMRTDPGGPGPS